MREYAIQHKVGGKELLARSRSVERNRRMCALTLPPFDGRNRAIGVQWDDMDASKWAFILRRRQSEELSPPTR